MIKFPEELVDYKTFHDVLKTNNMKVLLFNGYKGWSYGTPDEWIFIDEISGYYLLNLWYLLGKKYKIQKYPFPYLSFEMICKGTDLFFPNFRNLSNNKLLTALDNNIAIRLIDDDIAKKMKYPDLLKEFNLEDVILEDYSWLINGNIEEKNNINETFFYGPISQLNLKFDENQFFIDEKVSFEEIKSMAVENGLNFVLFNGYNSKKKVVNPVYVDALTAYYLINICLFKFNLSKELIASGFDFFFTNSKYEVFSDDSLYNILGERCAIFLKEIDFQNDVAFIDNDYSDEVVFLNVYDLLKD